MPYKKALESEKTLREVATELQLKKNPTQDELANLSDGVKIAITEAIVDINEDTFRLEEQEDFETSRNLILLAQAVSHVKGPLVGDIKEGKKEISKFTDLFLQAVEVRVKEATGKSCRFGVSKSVASAVNDISSCIHRVAEFLQDKVGEVETSGKCTFDDKSDPKLVEACKAWDKKTFELRGQSLYTEEDYNELKGRVIKDKLQLRVGSSPGHATHYDLHEGKVNYYDSDDAVNNIMGDLWKEVGLDCKKNPYGPSSAGETTFGVDCTGLNKDNVAKAAVVAAAATSMDYRFASPIGYWKKGPEELSAVMKDVREDFERKNIKDKLEL